MITCTRRGRNKFCEDERVLDIHPLDQNAPGLAQRLESLTARTRRAILSKACLRAASGVAGLEERTVELVRAIQSGGGLSLEQAKQAMSLADVADNKYFELHQRSAVAEVWLKVFSEARLLTGMAIAFGAVPTQGAADAVYELSKSCPDPESLLCFIDSEIDLAGKLDGLN